MAASRHSLCGLPSPRASTAAAAAAVIVVMVVMVLVVVMVVLVLVASRALVVEWDNLSPLVYGCTR